MLETCSNKELQRKELETVSSSAVLRKTVKKSLSNTGRMRERAAFEAFCSVWGITVCYVAGSGKVRSKLKERLDVKVVRGKMLKKLGDGIVVDISWWMQGTSVLNLSPRGTEGAPLCRGSLGEGKRDGMARSGG